jgi:hypothetical protein
LEEVIWRRVRPLLANVSEPADRKGQ